MQHLRERNGGRCQRKERRATRGQGAARDTAGRGMLLQGWDSMDAARLTRIKLFFYSSEACQAAHVYGGRPWGLKAHRSFAPASFFSCFSLLFVASHGVNTSLPRSDLHTAQGLTESPPDVSTVTAWLDAMSAANAATRKRIALPLLTSQGQTSGLIIYYFLKIYIIYLNVPEKKGSFSENVCAFVLVLHAPVAAPCAAIL